jgi:hypothetical protein
MARTKGSDDLFRLIHSLTPEEKGYFKKFARRHSNDGNKYLQLFDSINAQEKFEESTLKKIYKGYADMKVYLFNLVLDALMLLDVNSNEHSKIARQWFHTRILNRKGLATKSIQLSKRAIEHTEQQEVFWMEYNLRKNLYEMEKHGWAVQERAQQNQLFFDDLRRLHLKMEEEEEIQELMQQLNDISYTNSFSGKYNADFDKDMNLAILFEPKSTINAERLRYAALNIYCYVKQDFKNQLEYAWQFYKYEKNLWENAHPMAQYEKRVKSIRAVILGSLYQNKPEDVFALVEEMHGIKAAHRVDEVENELCYFTYNQYACWGTCRHKEGEAFTKEHFPHKLIAEFGKRFRLFIMEIYKFKVLFEFSNRNHQQLLKTIADFQTLNLKKTAPFHYRSCELIKILVQVESNAFHILPQLVTTNMKHLQSYGLTAGEKQVFSTFKKMNAANKRKVLTELKKRLEEGKEDLRIFQSINMKTWLTTQIGNRPMADVMAENRLKPGAEL